MTQVQNRCAHHSVHMVAKLGCEARRFQVRLELTGTWTGESVGRLLLWARGGSPVATVRARALALEISEHAASTFTLRWTGRLSRTKSKS